MTFSKLRATLKGPTKNRNLKNVHPVSKRLIRMKAARLSTRLAVAALFVATVALIGKAEAQNPYPDSLKKWVDAGKFIKFEGLDVFVHSSGKAPVEGHGVLIVHGFPVLPGTFPTSCPR